MLLCLAGSTTVLFAGVSSSAATLRPPVIAEHFTVLPCNHQTTLGMEGCAEGQLLAADHLVNRQVRLLFWSLSSTSQKQTFVKAETAWLRYRAADCQSVSATYEGGTFAPVEYALCEVRDDRSRGAALHEQYSLMEQDNSAAKLWPR